MNAPEPHIQNVFFAPILDHAIGVMGRPRTHEVLRRLGTNEETLRDRYAWSSIGFTEALCDALLAESGNPEFIAEASRLFTRGSYMGPLKPVFQAFGSPRTLLAQMPSISSHWNKAGRFEIGELHDASAVMHYYSDLESNVQMCHGRVAQFEAFPAFFGLPPGRVEHIACRHRGDERCTYVLEWQPEPDNTARRVIAGLAAMCTMGTLALLTGASWVAIGLLATSGLVIGWGVATHQALLAQAQARSDELIDQDVALRQSIANNNQRFSELLEAKQSVDRQVEERTHALERTTQQLAGALKEVQAADELKTRFFANVSHELRTPLQLILGPLQDLMAGREPAGGAASAYVTMNRSARRLHRLIDQLLDLARADAGKETLKRVALRPLALAQDLCATFQPKATAERITLEAVHEGPDSAALLDPHWMESALTNLIANALRHCDAGDTITVIVRTKGGRIDFEVRDTGPGIPAEDLGQLFDRFAQSDQKSGTHRGTGLGLAIVREAARLHGGEASVTSGVGVGTCFSLSVPRVEPAQTDVIAPSRPERASLDDLDADAATEAPPLPDVLELEGPYPEAPLAVVAEDEPDLRRFVSNVLTAQFRVVACVNGRLAYEKARALLPDVVVTDWSMPEWTGLELTRALRGNPDTARIPIVLLTAHGSMEHVLGAFDAGADDYVTKPFHGRELLARVDVHLRVRSLGREAVVRERLASVGMLSAELAHHLRNPLNMVKNGLQVLAPTIPDQPPVYPKLLAEVVECTKRMELITTDLLRISRGHALAKPAPHRLADGLNAAVRLTTTGLPSTVDLQATEACDGLVHGVAGDLNQVFLNLLDNAVRAIDSDGTIRVSTHTDDGVYHVFVEDSGPGVPEELRKHLFEAFVSSRAHGEGAGLGLAIAANVVRDHGGTIDVDASPSLGGARFRIAIPLAGEPEPA